MLNLFPPRGRRQWAQIYWLYLRSFPASERKPFSIIRKMYRKGKTDVWYFQKEGHFAGFLTTINGDDLILLDYLAVSKRKRGSGIGAEALQRICRHYAGKGVFLEIESTADNAPNQPQRLRRRRFYEKCGLEPMDVFAWVFGVKMELMGYDCWLTFEEYRDFYRDNYNPWAAEHIKPVEEQESA